MSGDDEPTGGGTSKRVSRSALLAGGGAAAASLALGRAASADAASWSPGEAGEVGVAGEHENAVELVFRIDQIGPRFTTYGYLTRVASLPSSSLFSSSRRDERTAHFTVYSETTMTGRSILGAVHALDVVGPMHVYLRQRPGATFAKPKSFAEGALIASYDGEFQSIVTVTAPRKGVESLTGSLRQMRAERFSFSGGSRILGREGLRLRVAATGTGKLLEAKQPRAVLLLAGAFVVASSTG